jgi:small ligand-binding sensory domain FIST
MVAAMGVHIGCGLSLSADPRDGAIEAAAAAGRGLRGSHADVAAVFCSGEHVVAPEATLEGVHEALEPDALIGCGAGGVLADGLEVEDGTAVAVWAADLRGGSAESFWAESMEAAGGYAVSGLPDLDGAAAAVLLPDPTTFPTEGVLEELARQGPGVPILGGLASARGADGSVPLLRDGEVVVGGAVGLRLEGVEVLPCVAQGAQPVGPELTVTACEDNVIRELAGRPALEAIRHVLDNLRPRDRAMLGGGLLLGMVVSPGHPDYERGDFLVRGLLGADPDEGTLVVGARVEPGTVVRLHARDALSADRDLRDALELRRAALGGAPPAGALVFTCNGRGRGLFGAPHHDARAVGEQLGGAPAAGFFAAGEIGPVGGRPFVHGFTATVAVFPP